MPEQLSFPVQRAFAAISTQAGRHKRLLMKILIHSLKNYPFARWGLRRVVGAVNAAQEHYARPALGDEGVARGQRALLTFDEFLATVEQLQARYFA